MAPELVRQIWKTVDGRGSWVCWFSVQIPELQARQTESEPQGWVGTCICAGLQSAALKESWPGDRDWQGRLSGPWCPQLQNGGSSHRDDRSEVSGTAAGTEHVLIRCGCCKLPRYCAGALNVNKVSIHRETGSRRCRPRRMLARLPSWLRCDQL